MDVDFQRLRTWWDAKADREDKDTGDEAINRALRWREIERNIEGVESVLDIGAGTGAFSIPLAQRGYAVTHLDISGRMLRAAQQRARGLRNISFVEGNAVDLSRFADASFDLVLNMDGAISFCGPRAEQAILESSRVCGRKLIVTVSNRARLATVLVSGSLNTAGRFLPAIGPMMDHGEWHQEQFAENVILARGVTQGYFPPTKAFLPSELRSMLEKAGMRVLRVGGLGSLSNLCGPSTVAKVLSDAGLLGQFLDLCERFDKEIMPEGPGTTERAGLIATAERRS